MFRPDVPPAVATLSVPLRKRGPARPLDMLKEQGITTFYWQYFQPPGVVEAEFARDWNHSLRAIYFGSGLGLMLEAGTRHGRGRESAGKAAGPDQRRRDRALRAGVFTHGIAGRDQLVPQHRPQLGPDGYWQDAKIHQPALFIAGSKDPVITGLIGEKALQTMQEIVPGLRKKVIIDGASHWISRRSRRK